MNDLIRDSRHMLGKAHGFLEQWKLARAVELALLVVLCFIAGRIFSYNLQWGDPGFSGFWVILIALLVTKQKNVELVEMQWRLVAIALGVAVGFVIINVFGLNPISLFCAVMLIAWLCAFFYWNDYQELAVLSLVVLLVSNYLIVDLALWAGAIGRILEAAIGMLLAYGVRSFFVWIGEPIVPSSRDSNIRY